MRLYWRTHKNMEENQNTASEETQKPIGSAPFSQNQSGVSFPTVASPQKSGGAKTILIVGILILVAVLGFVVYKSASKKSETTPEPTPFDNLTSPSEDTGTATSTPLATASSKPADKSTVSIVVQNGTGITGEAAYLQTQFKDMGFTDVKVSNASSQNETTTTVTFSKTLSSDVVAEITQKLNLIYQKVTTSTTTSGTSDVLVVTGLRKGATAKPSVTPTSSASPSATPKSTASPTASPSGL